LIKIEVICNWLKIIDKKFFKKLTIAFCVVFVIAIAFDFAFVIINFIHFFRKEHAAAVISTFWAAARPRALTRLAA